MQRATLAFNPNDIAVPFAKRVVHLVHDCSECGVLSIAEKDADRIEAITKRTGHA